MSWRSRLLTALFELSAGPYAALAKGHVQPWRETTASLLARAPGTLGRAIGEHLDHGGFELLPRLEDHDVFHVVLGIGASAVDEVTLQYALAGNGKRSVYLVGVIVLGALVFPEALPRFVAAWRRGQSLVEFHHHLSGGGALPLLDWPLDVVRPARHDSVRTPTTGRLHQHHARRRSRHLPAGLFLGSTAR